MTTLKKALKQKIQEWETAVIKQKAAVEDAKKRASLKFQPSLTEGDIDAILRAADLVNRYTAELKIMNQWLAELKELSK